MTEGSDYRKRAEECAVLAQSARTPAQRTMLLHIADTWLRLARDAEDDEQTGRDTEMRPQTRLRLM